MTWKIMKKMPHSYSTCEFYDVFKYPEVMNYIKKGMFSKANSNFVTGMANIFY